MKEPSQKQQNEQIRGVNVFIYFAVVELLGLGGK